MTENWLMMRPALDNSRTVAAGPRLAANAGSDSLIAHVLKFTSCR